MEKDIEIDWSGFDISKYPKVDPYKMIFRIGGQMSGYGGVSHVGQGGYCGIPLNTSSKYQWIIVSFLYFGMSISAFFEENYLIGIVCALAGLVYIISLPIIKYKGNKLYEKICKEQYKSEYIKRINCENYIKLRQNAILTYLSDQTGFLDDNFIEKRKKIFETNADNNPKINQASNWYNKLNCNLGDIILLNKDAFITQNKRAKECGLAQDYYVIAAKETHWLCCHAEEECIYSFSKTLGLTHTNYQSLYDYIIETCNIPFTQKTED